MDPTEVGCEGVNLIHMAQDGAQWWAVMNMVLNRIRKGGHHSDPCTMTVIDLLCNPLAQSFSSPAP